jgi:GT2 family glycosyltransferase
MNIFISVVSHGHAELLKRLNCVNNLAVNFTVVVKSNVCEELAGYCKSNNIHYIDDSYGLGFGANNNIIYRYCCDHLGMLDSDYFVVLNPDVIITNESIYDLAIQMTEYNAVLGAINLYKDEKHLISDDSIRNFPSLTQFIASFLGFGNTSKIDKNAINEPTQVDWAAGSFLCFKAELYKRLGGFNEAYFMYCEDIDICYRSYKLGSKAIFFPNIKAIHLAEHANRKLFSKHLYWHVVSVIRFLVTKFRL